MRLHYIYDPLCGWCYAAAPLVAVAAGLPGVEVALHGGGLFPAPMPLASHMRQHIRAADGRIAALSGQVFGIAYLDGLLADPQTTFHSPPTIAAVLAAEAVRPGQGLAMLKAIQNAHYGDGRRVAEPLVLADLAGQIGLVPEAFAAALAQAPVDAHMADTRRLMASAGVTGFPALLAEAGGGLASVPLAEFYGRPGAFAALLAAQLAA